MDGGESVCGGGGVLGFAKRMVGGPRTLVCLGESLSVQVLGFAR